MVRCENIDKFFEKPEIYNSLRIERKFLCKVVMEALDEALEYCPSITSIDLRNNTFENDHAFLYFSSAISKSNSINSMNLWNNNINATKMKYLSQTLSLDSSLSSFYFCQNVLSEEILEQLSIGLINNKSITDLSIWSNFIPEESVKYLAAIIKYNKTIVNFDLWSVDIGENFYDYVVNSIEHNMVIKDFHFGLRLTSHKDFSTKIKLDEVIKRNNIIHNNMQCCVINILKKNIANVPTQYLDYYLDSNPKLFDVEYNFISKMIERYKKTSLFKTKLICKDFSGDFELLGDDLIGKISSYLYFGDIDSVDYIEEPIFDLASEYYYQ